MAIMSLNMAMAKLAYYQKLVKELQDAEAAKVKASKIIKEEKAVKKYMANPYKIGEVKATQEKAVSKLTKSQQDKINISDTKSKVYKSKNSGKSKEWKLEHKTGYKQTEAAVNGGTVTNYGTMEKDRHQYLMDILNKAKISGMSVEAKSAAIEGVPKYNKKGKKMPGEDLDDTAYFKRAKTGTKRLARNLEKGIGTKQGEAFTEKIAVVQSLSADKKKELKGIKSKKAFFNFLINRIEYEQLGPTFVKMGNRTTRDFKDTHKYFGTQPTKDIAEQKRRENMMTKNFDDAQADADKNAQVALSEITTSGEKF